MTVAQHAVIEQWRRMVQDDQVDRVRCELLHEERRELGGVPVSAGGDSVLIAVDGYVDVAVSLGKPERV